jgi:hypothetical protein
MRLRLLLLAALLAVPLTASTSQASSLPQTRSADGADISWPNCPKGMGIPSRPTEGMPMPVASARFVVLGLTNGPGFTPNPCLADQVAWTKARHLWAGAYAVTTYPSAAQLTTYGGRGTGAQRLFRTGVAQAQVNVRNMRRAGLRPPMVWVDVEPVSVQPWSGNPTFNNAVLDGAVAGYRGAGLKVGFYSYAHGWKQITGGRRMPSVATWVPAGDDQRSSALARCSRPSFSGGLVLLAQWTAAGRDHNVTCPGVTGGPGRPSRFPGMFAST